MPNVSSCIGDLRSTGGYESNPLCNLNHGGPCGTCGELEQLDAQIEELHSRMKQLRLDMEDLHEKHRTLSLKRNAFHKCLITKLPYDIASDILIRACLPSIRPRCFIWTRNPCLCAISVSCDLSQLEGVGVFYP